MNIRLSFFELFGIISEIPLLSCAEPFSMPTDAVVTYLWQTLPQ